jgi:hypothetical protein
VLLTEGTRCLLTRNSERLEPRGGFALKGVSEPVPIYALTLGFYGKSDFVGKEDSSRSMTLPK